MTLVHLFAVALIALAIGIAGERSRTVAPMLMSASGVILLVLATNAVTHI